MRSNKQKAAGTLLLAMVMLSAAITGCTGPTETVESSMNNTETYESEETMTDIPETEKENNELPADTSAMNNTTYLTAGTDDLHRVTEAVKGANAEKQVGIFYFLWVGASSAEGPFDVSKVKAADPNAAESSVSWLLAGGGAAGQRHWWGESLFGYFRSQDPWVAERDVMMLTDAGIDFVAMDVSNGTEYPKELLVFMQALDKYYQQGFEVPKVTFITKASSGKVVVDLYDQFYMGHPEFSHLWYEMDGKPLMIGEEYAETVTVKAHDYFTWRYPQWPREGFHDDGFPWMDFSFPQKMYGTTTGTTVMSVSLAQHLGTKAMSSSALYGDDTNHTRSYHNGANDHSEDAVLYGYNFEEQFENAIQADPDFIFFTGWNEWIATRQASWTDMQGKYIDDPIILVDNCDINNSRDIQPMKGGYGDNYYMQMTRLIRKYKGEAVRNRKLNTAAETKKATLPADGDPSQWNAVESYYLDYVGDTGDRDFKGFGKLTYTDTTGRNDLYLMKMADDGEKLYAYAETAADIQGMSEPHCMSLFLSTGNAAHETWCGYDFVINRIPSGNGLAVEKRTSSGWEKIGEALFTVRGNKLQLEVPLSLLGLDGGPVSIQFKWADNYQGEDDIFSFYLNGDAAPYGRLNYVYRSEGTEGLPVYQGK
ncbi:MAG: hypothetical protein IK088_03715 [Lachnospiraceae bacterium]|nr:hypothetical protein [Lachnospiraceae bacterium]